MFSQNAQQKGLLFDIEKHQTVPPLLVSDAGIIRQSLVNLVGNAIKFTEQGFVRVEVRLDDEDDQPILQVKVSDSGIGIPTDKQDLIFEAFVQGDGAATRQYGGTGMGLYMTKRLITLLGGQLSCVSQLGQGSRFTLKVPVELSFQEKSDQERIGSKERPVSCVAGMAWCGNDQ